jgi:hypothetical protein
MTRPCPACDVEIRWRMQRNEQAVVPRTSQLTPAARKTDSLFEWRAAGILLILRAAATPTLRAYRSARWAAGIRRQVGQRQRAGRNIAVWSADRRNPVVSPPADAGRRRIATTHGSSSSRAE